ncbi:MAG: dynamin family protein [Cyanobacteria bacterium P01_D01_bin.123]
MILELQSRISNFMMDSKILDISEDLQAYRASLGDLLNLISHLAAKTNNPKLIKTVDGLRHNLDKPFMFVVVGEVKAGKSSFINALLETHVCEVDVGPCTDTVQAIYFSKDPVKHKISSHFVEIGKPIDILREISIVDTPGTNSVIENHQIITEEFIPNSDIAFFVLFAKNPYTASTWDFLDFVSSEWLRKIVFVLQQSDLLKLDALEANIAAVKKLAENKGIDEPTVFATSAEKELEGDIETSGFKQVREYIRNLITTKETYKLKLKNSTNTIRIFINELNGDIQALQERLDLDRKAVQRVRSRFDRGRKQSQNEVEVTGNRISEQYSRITEPIKEEFRQELSFFSVVRRTLTFSLKERLEDFSERCKTKLRSEIEEIAQERTSHILDGIRQFGEDLRQDLDGITTRQIEYSRFSIKVLERRQDVIENIKQRVANFLEGEGLVQSLNTGIEGAALIGTGGAFATIAVVVVQIIEIVVANFALAAFEVAFAGLGVIIFAVSFTWRRRTIIQKFERALDDGQNELAENVTQRLDERLSVIYDDLERVCSPFYDDVEQEEQEIVPLLELYSEIQTNSDHIFTRGSTLLD